MRVPTTPQRSAVLERSLQAIGITDVITTRSLIVTGYKPDPSRRRVWRQGSETTVGGALALIGQFAACLKPGSPRPVEY